MWIRIISAVLMILCGAFFGVSRSEVMKRRVAICSESLRMMRLCGTMIRTCGTDNYKLISILRREELPSLEFIRDIPDEYSAGADFHHEWRRCLDAQKDIPAEEKAILLEFGELLGTTDVEGQLRGIEVQQELMHSLFERRTEEYGSKGRLYRSVGLLAGVTLGIMVI